MKMRQKSGEKKRENRNRVDEFVKNPKKALFILALPMLVGMLVQAMYNIVDTAFVGRLGAESIAALTFSFPVFFILISFNSGLAVGAGSRISRMLGAKNLKEAENTAIHGLIISLALALIVFVLGILFLEPLFRLFGADENVLKLSLDFMGIIIFGIIFMFPAFYLSNIFTAQGDTKTAMTIQIVSLVLNIILDPIFIYVLGYGVKGAAIATLIAFVAALFLSVYFIKTKSYVKVRFSSFKFSWRVVKEIFSIGASASAMMLFMSISLIFFNHLMSTFGTDHVAAFGIAARLESLAFMVVVAFSIALVNLVGMFYGAKRYELIKDIVHYGMKVSIIVMCSMGAVFFAIPSLLLKIFTNDSGLMTLASNYLRIDVFAFPFIAISLVVSRSLQGLGFGMPGMVINGLRQLLIAVPLAYFFVLVLHYNYLSLAVAMILGSMVASIVAIWWFKYDMHKLHKKQLEEI